jgi:hypothetical protein
MADFGARVTNHGSLTRPPERATVILSPRFEREKIMAGRRGLASGPRRGKGGGHSGRRSALLGESHRRGASGKSYRWSREVTETSSALALEPGVFTWDDPHRIALSLRRSAERSGSRKAGPFQSAMSMLNFYINRAGTNLPAARRKKLEKAKEELRTLYGRPARTPRART